MRRRNIIIGLLAVAAMGTARAQQSKEAQRIAIVDPSFPVAAYTTSDYPFAKALFNELHRLGYVEGDSLLIEPYSGEGRAAHYPDLARDVVRRKPDVIISSTTDLTLDFKAATNSIPIVGVFSNPVGAGIVSSLARPGGNITGVSVDIGDEQWGKRLQLLKQMVPHATVLGGLPTRESQVHALAAGVFYFLGTLGLTGVGPPLNHPINEAEYRRVFAALRQAGAEVIIVDDESEHYTNLRLIIELAEKGRLPAIYPYREFVEAGGLMSYGVDLREIGRRVADMADRILKGAKPGEMPVFQPTKFELVINLKTAKALGLQVPPELLAVADEVID